MPPTEPPPATPEPLDPPAKGQLVRRRLVTLLDLLADLTDAERAARELGVPAETVRGWRRDIVEVLLSDPAAVRRRAAERGLARPLREALQDAYETIERRYLDKDTLLGSTTGFYDLDHMLSGLHPGALYLLAARPAMGRTSLALALARSATIGGAPVLFHAPQSSAAHLTTRLLAITGGIDTHRLRTGYLAAQDWGRLTEAIAELTDLPLVFSDDPAASLAELRAEARRLRAEAGRLGLVVIDSLELLPAPPGERDAGEKLGHALKRLARELEVPVLVTAPISAAVDNRRDHRPTLADVRAGEALVEVADVVMLLYRDEYYHPETTQRGTAEIIIARHRDGPIGQLALYFDRNRQRFTSISARSEP